MVKVYGGKISGGKAAARFGVDMDQLTVGGDYAAMGSLGAPMSETQRAAYAAQIDRIYASFIAHVAQGRKIPEDRVREIAGGRVWTGTQAKQLGLVDELGGLAQAVDKARQLAGLKGAVRLEMLPKAPSTFEAVQKMLGVSAASARGLVAAGSLLNDPAARSAIQTLADDRSRARDAHVLAPRGLP